MQVSSWVFYGLVEAVLFLAVLSSLMGLYLWRVKQRGQQVRGHLRQLLSDHRQLHHQLLTERTNRSKKQQYKQQIEEQLTLTRRHHQSLGGNRSIQLDMAPDTPLPRLTCAVRHAILIAEKEALHHSEDGTPDWQLLGERIARLVSFYQTATLSSTTSAPTGEVSGSRQAETAPPPSPAAETPDETHSPTTAAHDNESQQQFNKLRQLTTGQTQMMTGLNAYFAESDAEKQQALLKQLNIELGQQKLWASEVDNCVKVLEDELLQAAKRINELEKNLDESQRELEQITRLQTTIRDLKGERREQRQRIEELEQITNQFLTEPHSVHSESEALQEALAKLSQLQAEYDALVAANANTNTSTGSDQ